MLGTLFTALTLCLSPLVPVWMQVAAPLRDDTIMDIVENYLELDLPEGAAAQTADGKQG